MSKPLDYLRSFFGYQSFRSGQKEIIDSLINGNDTLAVMPTGGGKSICYQIPALLFDGLTIVISPLISLMKDQVDVLNSKGINAAYINSSLDHSQINLINYKVKQKEIKLLYLAPERINSSSFVDTIKNIDVSFIAVDEAHCISEWGHDFRPAFREISTLSEMKSNAIIGAFTATATRQVRDDISRSLKLNSPNLFVKGFDRGNLSYFTEHVDDKTKRIKSLIKSSSGSTIIYAGSRKRVEKIYYELKGSLPISYYHAGLNERYRQQQQDDFLQDKTKIIVATSAFGMGIDKPDVRLVIHTDLTPTLEAYYQEAGRAGRDGEKASCYLLINSKDRGLQDFFISTNYPSTSYIKKIHDYLYDLTETKHGDYPSNLISQTQDEIGLRSGMDQKDFNSVFKFLERENIVQKVKASAELKVKIIADRSRIKEFFDNTSDENRSLLESLLRSLSSDAYHQAVILKKQDLLYNYRIKDCLFDSGIKQLQFSGIIQVFGSKGSGYRLSLPRPQKGEYPIDFKKHFLKSKNAFDKVDIVEEYTKIKSCKRNYILNYFGEKTADDCGRCSYCLCQRSDNSSEKEKYVISILENALRTFPNKNNNFIYYLLKGSQRKEITSRNLEKHNLFGKLKELSKKEFEKYLSQTSVNGDKTNDLDELIENGFSIREISLQTGQKLNHIIKAIGENKVESNNIETLFPYGELTKIKELLANNPDLDARRIQQFLGPEISFLELKLIIKLLNNDRTNN